MLDKIEINDQIIRLLLNRVVVYKERVEIVINKNILLKVLEKLVYNEPLDVEYVETDFITINQSVRLVAVPRHGNKLIIGDEVEYNLTLIQAITKGFFYYKLWQEGKLTRDQKNSYTYRLMSLRYLPPKVVKDVLSGKQPADLTVKKLYELAKI